MFLALVHCSSAARIIYNDRLCWCVQTSWCCVVCICLARIHDGAESNNFRSDDRDSIGPQFAEQMQTRPELCIPALCVQICIFLRSLSAKRRRMIICKV